MSIDRAAARIVGLLVGGMIALLGVMALSIGWSLMSVKLLIPAIMSWAYVASMLIGGISLCGLALVFILSPWFNEKFL